MNFHPYEELCFPPWRCWWSCTTRARIGLSTLATFAGDLWKHDITAMIVRYSIFAVKFNYTCTPGITKNIGLIMNGLLAMF